MSLLQRLFERRGASFENPSTSLANPAAWLVHFFGGEGSDAGVNVNERAAMGIPAIYACVRIIAESIASLPLQIFERLDDGGRRVATDHPLYDLLHLAPNEWQTSFSWRETGTAHQALWGNGYSWIDRAGNGDVLAMYTLRPDQVTPRRDNARRWYEYTPPDGRMIPLAPDQVLHWPALGFDGLVGLSPIRLMRQSVGLTMAAERFGAKFFGSGAHPSGILSMPNSFSSDKVRDRVLESWKAAYSGLDNAQKTAVLEEGLEFKPITIPPEDAQFLQTRELQVKEAARMYRVPLHMLADLSQAPAANVEQGAIDFVVHTLRPWLVRQEQELNLKLLDGMDRRKYFIEYNISGLLRGDSKARAEFYRQMWGIGVYSINEIRRRENDNPVENGDQRFVPLNMVPLEQAGDLAAAKASPTRSATPAIELRDLETRQTRSVESRRRTQRAHRRLFVAAARSVVLREHERVGRQARRMLPDGQLREFEQWLGEFYEEFGDYIVRQWQPPLAALAEVVQAEAYDEIGGEPGPTHDIDSFLAGYAQKMARGYAASSRRQLQALLDESEAPAEAVQQRIDEWRDKRPDKEADRHVVEAGSAFAKAAYAAAGVISLRWVTVGDNCPLCRSMNGRTVGIQEPFVAAGESVVPEGAAPLTARRMISHPPLHAGCDCAIVSGG